MAKNRVRTCSSRNCKEKYSAKGLCKHHYDRKYKQRPEVKAMVKARELTPKYKVKYGIKTLIFSVKKRSKK